MKYGNKDIFKSERRNGGGMKRTWIWMAVTLIAVMAAGCVFKPDDTTRNESVTTPAYTPVTTDTSIGEMQSVVIELPSSIHVGAYSSGNGTISIPKNLYIHSYPPDVKGYYIVQFKGPIYEEYKVQVTDLGGELFGFIREHAFIVKMNGSTKNKVQKLDIVQWVGIYQPAYKIYPGFQNKKGNVSLNILIFGGENITDISHKLKSIGGMNLLPYTDFISVYINGSKMTEIANINGVMWIEELVLPTIQSEGAGI